MVCRIEVALKSEFADSKAADIAKKVRADYGLDGLLDVRRAHVYGFEDNLTQPEAHLVAKEVLADALSQKFALNQPVEINFAGAIEIGFRPGVKDNVGETAQLAASEAIGRPLEGGVFTSTLYFFYGEAKLDEALAKKISEGLLCNPLIERHRLIRMQDIGHYYANPVLPKAGMGAKGSVFEVPLPDDENELEKISKRRLLALDAKEMKVIAGHYRREDVRRERAAAGLGIHPTDVELECVAQTWSEHCKHKIFNALIDYEEEDETGDEKKTEEKTSKDGKNEKSKKGKKSKKTPIRQKIDSLFKTYIAGTTHKIKSAQPYLLSVFDDNAGILALDEDWALAVKVETHNTPSALDPYGGALTGILGVNRDVLGTGLGAKPIFNTDVFCFADPFYKGAVPPRLLHPRRVFEGVRAGVEKGGNASGIPTVNGSIYFDERYLGKPLVYCGTGGLMPRNLSEGRKGHLKNVKPKDRIFMVGGRVGKDGIHGATFSSEGLHEGSPTSAVQLGDPFTQKKMLDFLLESRDRNLHSGLTDDGAGGLSSSVGEMAQLTNGAVLHLERCPLKYPGLDPWEIFVSESQERMTVAVPAPKAGEFAALAAEHGVEATDLGEFTSSGYLEVFYHNHAVARLNLHFLHKGLPRMHLSAVWTEAELEEPSEEELADAILDGNVEKTEASKNPTLALLELLARPNICSKESVIRQYDHEVQGMSVIKPLCGKKASGPSDAAVLQPLPGKPMGIAVSHGLCPRAGDIDPHGMAQLAVDEAVRNYVATGGDPAHWGALDNFCWPDPVRSEKNPDGPRKLAALVRANQGLAQSCLAYSLPLISGKDSMKNDYAYGGIRISVPPTLLVSVCGVMKDAARAVSSDFKQADDVIYALGRTYDEMGASEYYAMFGQLGAHLPRVRLEDNIRLYRHLHHAMERGLVASAHDCSDGGLAVALAECAIGGQLGCRVHLNHLLCEGKMSPAHMLFSESAGRFVVSVHPSDCARFEAMMQGTPYGRIGSVSEGEEFAIGASHADQSIKTTVETLEKSFKKTITW